MFNGPFSSSFLLYKTILKYRFNYSLGWTKWYEFSMTDLQTCLTLTEDIWKKDVTRVQWQFIKGLINEAVYWGRIEKIDDLPVLEAYSEVYFRDDILSSKWKPFGLDIRLPNTGLIQVI